MVQILDERVRYRGTEHLPNAVLTGSQTVRDIELELHTEIYPGTEVMRDVGTHHFVKGGDSVLVPQPSDDEYVCCLHGVC